MYTQQSPRGECSISLDRMHCKSVMLIANIISSPFPYLTGYTETYKFCGKQTRLASGISLWVYTHMSRCFDIPLDLF